MRCWITGIAGFLGSHLADELEKLGHDVKGNDSGICSSVPVSPMEKFDCCDQKILSNIIAGHGTEVLVHTAALAHEGFSNFSPSFITNSIYSASVATFSAAIAAGVKRIIFFSSMARYGKQKLPFTEDMIPMPRDPYAISKVAAELTLKSLCELHDVEYVILIPHSIIGPRQKYDDSYRNVCSIMINRALQNKPIYVYGDGLQKRCFSPIEDCLDSIVKSITAPVNGQSINIGPDEGEITVLELANIVADKCAEKTGIRVETQHLEDRPNEVKMAYCSSDKARKLLDYKPVGNLSKCIDSMIEYILKQGTKPFVYDFPTEIEKGLPKVWANKML